MKVERLNEVDVGAFLDFSDSLYARAFRTENKRELREVLEGKHTLSHYSRSQRGRSNHMPCRCDVLSG